MRVGLHSGRRELRRESHRVLLRARLHEWDVRIPVLGPRRCMRAWGCFVLRRTRLSRWRLQYLRLKACGMSNAVRLLLRRMSPARDLRLRVGRGDLRQRCGVLHRIALPDEWRLRLQCLG